VQEHQCGIGIVEVWADISGYEGRYQVSSLGRVKSLARVRKGKNNSSVPVIEKIMKTRTKVANGRQRPYVDVCLRDGGQRDISGKQKLVHRLVANAFIKQLEDGDQVDHLNGIHSDNRVENLRVMKMIEHARIHPTVLNPCERNLITGQYMPRSK
jgi:hypothetical protein